MRLGSRTIILRWLFLVLQQNFKVMNRKDFLKSSGLLIGGTMLPSKKPMVRFHKTEENESFELKKCVGLEMIKDDLPLIDKLRMVKDIGFEGIELNSPTDIDLKEILNAKDSVGIAIPSTINKDHWKSPLSDPDPKVRESTIRSVAQSLEETKILGGDTVLVVPGVVNNEVSYAEAYDNSLDSIRKLIPYAEKTRVKIGIENVWNNFLISPLEAKEFVDKINHPLIGWYFDIGNVPRYGWPSHWIEVLQHRILKLHMKAFSTKKMNDEGLWKGFDINLLDEGDIDWKEVIVSLRRINYKEKWFRVEMSGGDRSHLEKISLAMDEIIKM